MTGTPVKIGLISPEGGALGSLPDAREAAQAAAEYVNKNLGGLAGHELELVICKEKEDPASAHDCANQMASAGIVAVVAPVTSQGDALVPTITGAGIPYVTMMGTSASEMTADNSHIITSGLPGSFGGTAAYAAGHQYKKVAMLVEDAGSVMSGVQMMAGPAFQQAGIGLKVVGVPMGTPDATPQVSAALGDHPDAVLITGDGTLCTSVLRAMQTLGSTAAKLAPQTCMGPEVLSAVGNAAVEGVHIVGNADVTSSDPDSVLFRSVMAKYAPSTSIYGYAYSGYQALLGFVRGVEGVKGNFTAATVSAALGATNHVQLPIGHGLTYTCDGHQVPMLKAICGKGAIITTVKDGKPADPEVVQ
ncbi:ABC transporter substrate-binding protein [Nocardia miyunensis]|uniref:ABC transporter substrate-binding protein n=1 Tax=Nocardia miyunensis TaxID=282684 RepID=UPI000A91F368|nr:ABC transporter substrate-binding protein [Nocardia miyunensis]